MCIQSPLYEAQWLHPTRFALRMRYARNEKVINILPAPEAACGDPWPAGARPGVEKRPLAALE